MCAGPWRQESMTTNNWKLTLAYDGTAFHGWQVQPGGKTIQGTLSDAIAIVAAERVLPQGAGRTDAGVHAAGQVASFALAAPIPADNFLRALNRVLPSAIRVLSAEKTAPDFHARHSSVSKVYRYRVFHGPVCSPFLAPYVACSRWPLDMEAMQRAAKEILGEHDFTSFAASDPDRAARLADENDAGTSQSAASDLGAPRSPSVSNIRRIDESQWSCEPLCGASVADVRAELSLRVHDSRAGPGKLRANIYLYDSRQWFSAPYGPQPGRNFSGSRPRTDCSRGHPAHFERTRQNTGGADRAGKWFVPDEGALLVLSLTGALNSQLVHARVGPIRAILNPTPCRRPLPVRRLKRSANWPRGALFIARFNGSTCRNRSCASGIGVLLRFQRRSSARRHVPCG